MFEVTTSNIQEFYFNRSIFITGATGFMGKVLVEKLLRSCESIARVYLLIRPSRGKDAKARLEELLNCPIFEWLKQNRPESLSKLVAVSGDVSLPELGISPSDILEIKENVTLVFHSAARVKFDEDLRSAIESNVKGPKLVSAFCQQLKNIEAFVHVSTTFNNLDRKEITEEVFPATTNPHKLIDFIDSIEDSLLANLVKPLIGKCPNVYAFSKALGEQLLQKECNACGIPLVIVRPSTVGAAMEEPIPGWVDNMNGASGIIVGVGKGIIRSIKINTELVTDLIPVDFPINLMISAAWDRATSNNPISNVPVYNCSTGTINPLTWEEFARYSIITLRKFPFKEIVWYPGVMLTANDILFKIGLVLYHYLPGYALDMVARIIGRKPFLVGLYKKVDKAMTCLEYYRMNQWNFVSRNPAQLMKRMTDEDRKNFNFGVTKIDWESYMETYVNGVRTFVVKDDPKDLPKARKHLKRMKNVGSAIRLFLLLLFFAVLFTLLQCMHLYSIDMATNNGTITAIELAKQEMLKLRLQIIPPFANYK